MYFLILKLSGKPDIKLNTIYFEVQALRFKVSSHFYPISEQRIHRRKYTTFCIFYLKLNKFVTAQYKIHFIEIY